MDILLFDSWSSILRTLVIGISAYASLILLLRISGKRTLSKMNAFDFIVTIALGSTLATVLLNKNVALADGVLAFALLILFQYIITWLSVRAGKIKGLVKSTPSLLFYKGNFLDESMRSERITREEILAGIRQTGIGAIEDVDAIVLETDGSMSVISRIKDKDTVLSNVRKRNTPHFS